MAIANNKVIATKSGERIGALNVNGLNDADKQFRALQYLNMLKADIFVLTDTRLKSINGINSKFPAIRDAIFCEPVDTLVQDRKNPEIFHPGIGRGVLVTARPGSGISFENARASNDGNKITVDVLTSKGATFKLIALYGPSEDDPSFFVNLIDSMLSFEGNIISIGDFNVKLDPDKDITPFKQGRTLSKKANFLNARINEGVVSEPFRCFHPTDKVYSYRHYNQKNVPRDEKAQSRIDLCLVSPETLHCIKNIQYIDIDHDIFDHSGIFVDLNIIKFEFI